MKKKSNEINMNENSISNLFNSSDYQNFELGKSAFSFAADTPTVSFGTPNPSITDSFSFDWGLNTFSAPSTINQSSFSSSSSLNQNCNKQIFNTLNNVERIQEDNRQLENNNNRLHFNENIPFVQIHTTDVGPQKTNFGHSFRRNNNSDVIKSEPIKSEGNDPNKENASTSPVLQANIRFLEISTNTSTESNKKTNKSPSADLPNNNDQLVNDIPPCFKCSKCRFITIVESQLENHMHESHGQFESPLGQDKKQKCPGCENIFFSWKSLEAHLSFDHFVSKTDLASYHEAFEKNGFIAKAAAPSVQQKIYLKNVDCLIEPQRVVEYHQHDVSCSQSNLISSSNDPNNSGENVDSQTNPSKQKISIKSVDVLREPSFLQQQNNLEICDGFLNCLNPEIIPTDNASAILMENHLELNTLIASFDESLNNRRPKIYLKNMDNLKKPTFISNGTEEDDIQNSLNYAFIPENSFNQNDFSDDNLMSGESFVNQFSDTIPFENSPNQYFLQTGDVETDNIGSYLNTDLYDATSLTNNLNCDLDTNHSEIGPMVTEPTPPPASAVNIFTLTNPEKRNFSSQQSEGTFKATRQKIFIKNVDILKEPQYQEHQRGTLHLRTVDQLNLMNRNEVEGLITPNIQHNFSGTKLQANETVENRIPISVEWPIEDYIVDELDGIMEDNMTTISAFDHMSASLMEQEINLSVSAELMTLPNKQELILNTNSFKSSSESAEIVVANESNIIENNVTYPKSPIINNNENINNHNNNNTNSNSNSSTKVSICSVEILKPNNNARKVISTYDDVPPLAPFTKGANTHETFTNATVLNNISNIPVPPLVPMRTSTNLDKSVSQKCLTKSNLNISSNSVVKDNEKTLTVDKGRIYVSNNLLETNANENLNTSLLKDPIDSIEDTTGTKEVVVSSSASSRGRPFGSKTSGITKMRKLIGKAADLKVGKKCSVQGCAFRFQEESTLDYHMKCHNGAPNAVICPECGAIDFNNWNTLHTHLWRVHKIDMELYKCNICNFKTPIFSRLVNTHMKTHSDERNFKCEQCSKSFKNSKQLKNHRRLHRTGSSLSKNCIIADCTITSSSTGVSVTSTTNPVPSSAQSQLTTTTVPATIIKLYNCATCTKVFSNSKSVKEHFCPNSEKEFLVCDSCKKLFTSKASLKLHMRTHQPEKRFECTNCTYSTSDHNAFRRHKLTHSDEKHYQCTYCNYKAIQSTTFQKHLKQQHPDQAEIIILKCNLCSFSTINHSLYLSHQATHLNRPITVPRPADENTTIEESSGEIIKELPINP